MAARKPGKVAAPVKQKLRKNHGPKKHLFKEFKPMVHLFAQDGLLTKYNNFESFSLSCAARGVKNDVAEMWTEFRALPRDKQDEYLKNIKENSVIAIQRSAKRKAKKKVAENK